MEYKREDIFFNVSEKTRKTMSAIKSKNNRTTELKLKMLLVKNGISGWKTNYKEIEGTPDFYFINEKIAIYVDGCFWHGCPKCGHIPKIRTEYWERKIENNKKRDLRVTKDNEKDGILVLRIWEHQLKKSDDRKVFIKKVQDLIYKRIN